LVIAIDGPAASGKSTTARLVAARLGYLHVDTGSMYRAMTHKVLSRGIDPGDGAAVGALAAETEITLVDGGPKDSPNRVFLDGADVTSHLREPEVTAAVSRVSMVKAVRELMLREQRRLAKGGGVVLEGRDIGTVVLPEADLKIWLVADVESRAARRLKELKEQRIDTELDEIRDSIRDRDRADSERELSPLRKASDAAEVDTTGLTVEQQVEIVVKKAKELLR
jgi:cytidylate kinase